MISRSLSSRVRLFGVFGARRSLNEIEALQTKADACFLPLLELGHFIAQPLVIEVPTVIVTSYLRRVKEVRLVETVWLRHANQTMAGSMRVNGTAAGTAGTAAMTGLQFGTSGMRSIMTGGLRTATKAGHHPHGAFTTLV